MSLAAALLGGGSAGVSTGASIAAGLNFAAVWTLGSLMQYIALFSLINVPIIPIKLVDFY